MSNDKNKAAQTLGRLGGIARAKKLSKERMREIALQGYKASPLSSKRKACQSPQTDENKK